MSTTTTNVNEYDAIAMAIQPYIDGAKSGKGDAMKPAFHTDATIFGYVGADLFAGPIQQLFAWNDQNGPATGLQARIASIDLIDTVATVPIRSMLTIRAWSPVAGPFWSFQAKSCWMGPANKSEPA